ncbi:hypothetical protein PLICRDRAFT_44586, partial [Plicaturopsis crispa FD-325 SS-3]
MVPASPRTHTISDLIKPHRAEAVLRLRNSALGLLALAVLAHLSPLPSPYTSVVAVIRNSDGNGEGEGWGKWWWGVCAAESILLGLLTANILQSLYAIKFPRTPHPPLPSPSPSHAANPTSPAPKRRLGALSPNNSPQRSFSSSSYASSPVSTPSRTLNYPAVSPFSSSSPFNTSLSSPFNTSLSLSLPPTPSPVLSSSRSSMHSSTSLAPMLSSPLAAYRGKHASSVGRALNESILTQLAGDSDD